MFTRLISLYGNPMRSHDIASLNPSSMLIAVSFTFEQTQLTAQLRYHSELQDLSTLKTAGLI